MSNWLLDQATESAQDQDWKRARVSLKRYYDRKPGIVAAQKALGLLKTFPSSEHGAPLRIAFLRSYTVEPLLPLIEAEALLAGMSVQIQVGGFNSYAQEILYPGSSLYSFNPDIVFLAVQARDLVPDLWERFAELKPEMVQSSVERASIDLNCWVDNIRRRSAASIVLQTLETPFVPNRGILDAQLADSQKDAFQSINSQIRRIASSYSGVFVLDYERISSGYGKARFFDQEKWVLMRMPVASDAVALVAHEYVKFIYAISGKMCKVLVTDLDNTLWGGVIGEEGLEGIKLGHDYPGQLYRNVQRAILDVSMRGILLAICSKNNPNEAFDALDKHPSMLLRSHHFAAIKINWQDKPQNLREIAADLNVGIDALAFLDDSAAERDIVARELPEVHIIELPQNPLGYAEAIRDCPFLERVRLSIEDRKRRQCYTEEQQRHAAQRQSTSLEDFYRSLEMRVTIRSLDSNAVKRVAQLTQKTNQFNLTTRRYSEQQIEAMRTDSATTIYALSCRDRFGDSGIVGVGIIRVEECACEVDTFLLSCRVIGRTLERALLHDIVEEARLRGCKWLRGWFFPTAKNAPAKEFYTLQGFKLVEARPDGGQLWQVDLDQFRISWPTWILSETPEQKCHV